MPFDLERDDELANLLESELSEDELIERQRVHPDRVHPMLQSVLDSVLDYEADEK
jgi:rRNA pseudouridine-1189 N-methylase Emg1 (Nep1/Mra1 family)